jgi:hypothetical protein
MVTHECICRAATYGVIHWAEQHMLHGYFNGIPEQVGGGGAAGGFQNWNMSLHALRATLLRVIHVKLAKQTRKKKIVCPHLSAPKLLNMSL